MEPIRGPVDYHSYPPRRPHSSRIPGGRQAAIPPQSAAEPSLPGPPLTPRERRRQQRRRMDHPDHSQQAPASSAQTDAAGQESFFVADALPDDSIYMPERTRRARHSRHLASVAPQSQAPAERDEAAWGEAAEKETRTPLWKYIRGLVIVLCLVGVAELIAAALTSPHFEVRAVAVDGLKVTPEAAVEPIKNQLIGQNWFRAHMRQVAREATSLPTVHTAFVGRELSWPPRLTLHIEERQPFVRVGAGDEWWVVDQEGVPFRRAAPDDTHLYAVTGGPLQPRLGQPLPPRAWRPVVEFTAALADEAQHGQDWTLRRIYIDKNGFASLRLTGGAHDEMLVRLGARPWPEKLRRARRALAYFEATGRHAVALNFVSLKMPTWTPQRLTSPAIHSPDPSSRGAEGTRRAPDEIEPAPDIGGNEPAGT